MSASNVELDIFRILKPQQGSSQNNIETCTSANKSVKKRSTKVHPSSLSVLGSGEGGDTGKPSSTENTTGGSILSEEDNDNASKEEDVGNKDKNRSIWWWEPGESLLLDFLKLTSLHGIPHAAQSERHLTERLFWLVTFLIGLGLAFFLIGDLFAKASSNPVIVSFRAEKSSVDQIPFPAITICNMNKVLKSKADEYLGPSGNPEDVYYLRHVCDTKKGFTERRNYTGNKKRSKALMEEAMYPDERKKEWTKVTEFLLKAAQNCTDMIPFCMWQNRIIDNCSELFRPVETEYGKCCVFNTVPPSLLYKLRDDKRDDENEIYEWEQWDIDDDGFLLPKDYKYDFPRRQMQAGKSFGLSFVLNPALDEYFCTSSYSQGFRMSAHLPMDLNRVTDFGVSIITGGETFVSVKPEITLVDPAVYNLAVGTRDCYKLEEYPLKYFKYYTTSNCVQECIANETLRICGCKAYYMPRDRTQSLCSVNLSGSSCVEEVEYNMTKLGSTNLCKMCLPSCNEIHYETKSTLTKLQSIDWRKSLETNKMTLESKNTSIVHVYFGQDAVYPRLRKVLFQPADLIGNAGGVMSLCIGFSGMSLVELLYFLTLRAWWYHTRKQNKSGKKNKDASKDATTDLGETRRSGSSVVVDRDLEAADDDGSIFISRKHEGVNELPIVSIEDECSTIVELE